MILNIFHSCGVWPQLLYKTLQNKCMVCWPTSPSIQPPSPMSRSKWLSVLSFVFCANAYDIYDDYELVRHRFSIVFLLDYVIDYRKRRKKTQIFNFGSGPLQKILDLCFIAIFIQNMKTKCNSNDRNYIILSIENHMKICSMGSHAFSSYASVCVLIFTFGFVWRVS